MGGAVPELPNVDFDSEEYLNVEDAGLERYNKILEVIKDRDPEYYKERIKEYD